EELPDDVRAAAVHREAEDGEALVAVLLVDALEAGHLEAARRAPGRPEVDEHDLPAQVAQRDRASIQRLDAEVGRVHATRVEAERRCGLGPHPVSDEPENGDPERRLDRYLECFHTHNAPDVTFTRTPDPGRGAGRPSGPGT